MPKKAEDYGAWLKLDKPGHIVGFLMKSLQHTMRHSMDEALRRRGLEVSFAHFAALFGLHCEPGITGAKLARRTMVSAQTMNAALHRLEIEGRVERRPHPDSRRADSWYLTADGRDLLDQARAVGSEVFERMLAPLEADEIASLESCLRRCIIALEGADTDDAAADADDDAPTPARRSIKRGSRQPEARSGSR